MAAIKELPHGLFQMGQGGDFIDLYRGGWQHCVDAIRRNSRPDCTRVLVTGATGFIGRHLVQRLLCEGYRLRALVLPETDSSWLDAHGVEVVRGDVCNPHVVECVVGGCQVIWIGPVISNGLS